MAKGLAPEGYSRESPSAIALADNAAVLRTRVCGVESRSPGMNCVCGARHQRDKVLLT